jgi:transcriptional regulator with XRE-family HTH domain
LKKLNLAQSEQFSLAIAEELKTIRESSGISQYELAKRSGVSRTMIHHIENGRRNPTLIVTHALTIGLKADFSKIVKKVQVNLKAEADVKNPL